MDTPDVPGISNLRLHKAGHGTVIYLGRQVETSDAVEATDLAAGAAAVADLAAHNSQDVAVKVFGDFSYVERDKFTRQWRVSGLLNGLPGIANVHEGGVGEGGKPYVVREFVDGASLAQELEAGRPSGELNIAQAVHHITAVADVVAYGHRNGVIHGALKPTNVFRGPDGAPIITDFSLPGLTDHGAERSLDDAALPYVAPEVRAGATSTQAADVYALGAMLYSSITGVPPAAAGIDATDPSFAGLPSDLARATSAALAEQPQDRPRSAALFAQSLRRAVPKVPGMTAAAPVKSVRPATKTPSPEPAIVPTAAAVSALNAPSKDASTIEPVEVDTPTAPAAQIDPPQIDPPQIDSPQIETVEIGTDEANTVEIEAATVEPIHASAPHAAQPKPSGHATSSAPANSSTIGEPAVPAPPSRPASSAVAPEPASPVRVPGSHPAPAYGQPRLGQSQPSAPVASDGPNLRRWALIGAAALIGAVLVVGFAWNFLIDLTRADTIERPVEVAATDNSDTTDGAGTSDQVTTSGDASDSADAASLSGNSDPAPETIPQPWPTTAAEDAINGGPDTGADTETDTDDAGDSSQSGTAAADVAPRPTTSASSPPVATLPAAPAAPSTNGAEPEPTTGSLEATDEGLTYTGPRFEADLPVGWQPITEDSDVGYGYRTRFNGPDNDFLYVDLTPPTHHNGQETIEESAYRIAEQVSSSGPVYKLTIGSKVTYWFEYIGNDGSQRIDVFFTIGDTGYAVVGGSHDDPADAYRALIKFIDSLEQV